MSNVKTGPTNEELPSYHETVTGSAPGVELRPIDLLPDFDVDFEETKEHETGMETTIMSHALTHDTKTLEQYLTAQAQIEPHPIVRIRGSHKTEYEADGYWRYGERLDFDLTISLRELLADQSHKKVVPNQRKAYRGTRTKRDNLGKEIEAFRHTHSLEQWCRDFCKYRKGPKKFTFTRTMGSLDRTVPIEAIEKVLRDIKYKGNIQVTIEAEDQKTTLVSDHPMARIRHHGFYWSLCIISQLWVIFWLLSKQWEVFTIEWPTRSSQMAVEGRTASDMGAAWAEKWKLAIARAALSKATGRIYSATMSAPGVPWKTLGDFDEVQPWGSGE